MPGNNFKFLKSILNNRLVKNELINNAFKIFPGTFSTM